MTGFKGSVNRKWISKRNTDVRLGHVRVHVPGIETDHFFRRVAQHLGIAPVDFDNPVLDIENDDAVAGIFDQRPTPFCFVRQRHLARFLDADVAPNGHAIVPAAQADGPDADLDIKDAAILAAVPIVEAGAARRSHL